MEESSLLLLDQERSFMWCDILRPLPPFPHASSQVTFFAAIGGFLFGYDTGVISSALLLLANDFPLSDVAKEFIVSIALGGFFPFPPCVSIPCVTRCRCNRRFPDRWMAG